MRGYLGRQPAPTEIARAARHAREYAVRLSLEAFMVGVPFETSGPLVHLGRHLAPAASSIMASVAPEYMSDLQGMFLILVRIGSPPRWDHIIAAEGPRTHPAVGQNLHPPRATGEPGNGVSGGSAP